MGWLWGRSPRQAKVSSFSVLRNAATEDSATSPGGSPSGGSPSRYGRTSKKRNFSIHAATSQLEEALHKAGKHEYDGHEYATTLYDKIFYTLDEMMLNNYTTALVIATPYAFIVLPILSAAWYLLRTHGGDSYCADDDEAYDDDGCLPDDYGYFDAMWETWGFQADPGTHSGVTGTYNQILSAVIALTGMAFWFTFAAFIVDRFQEMMETLKRGRNKVVEKDHVVILGFTDKTLALICELSLAMESEGGGVIVIMDARNPAEVTEMIDEELDHHYDLRGTKLVVRQGNPSFVNDLRRISTAEARAVVVLAPNREGDDIEQADATVLRTVLSLKGMPEQMQGHIVAELNDVDNRQIVELIGEMDVETVVSHDICGRLMLMAARHPGLATVYDKVFGFQGNEFYLKNWPELEGRTFGEVMTMFPDAVPIGVISTKTEDEVEYLRKLRNAQTQRSIRSIRYGMCLNPPLDYVMQATDNLLVLAEDDDTYRPVPAPTAYNLSMQMAGPNIMVKEKTLLCGWRRDMEDLITVLDCEVGRGSEIHIVAEVPIEQRMSDMDSAGFDPSTCANVTLVHHIGNSAIRRQLLNLPLGEFDNVLILADQSRETKPLDSDAHNLATMLLIRDIRATMLMEMNLDRQHSGDEPQEGGSRNAQAPMLGETVRQSGSSQAHEEPHRPRSWVPGLSPLGKKEKNVVNQKRSPVTARDAARQRSLKKLQHTFVKMDSMVMDDPTLSVVGEEEDERTRGAHAHGNKHHGKKASASRVRSLASGVGEGVISGKSVGRSLRSNKSTLSTVSHRSDDEHKEADPTDAHGEAAHQGAHPDSHGRRHIEDDCLICCEILDSRTRSTLYHNPTVAHEAEYVLSHMTVSKVISMVAMKREVRGVLEELLAEEGQSFFVMPITRYVDPTSSERYMSFMELSVRVKQSDDLLIGYQRAEADHAMEINPPDKQAKITWREGDFVVVVCDICRVFRAGVTPHTGKRRKLRPPGSLTPGSAKSSAGKTFSFGGGGSGVGGGAAGWTPPSGGAGEHRHQHEHGQEEVFSPASTLQTLQSPELDRGLQLGSLGHTPSGRAPTFPETPLVLSVNPSDSLSLSASANGTTAALPELVVGPPRTQLSLTTVQAFQMEVEGGPLVDSPTPSHSDV
mmetsp:Transcript_27148/g.63449  ORF Transcript_27148/g.63449 Transcript_27148/m.63449 type:complete len:1139 (+) Transcript_27148:205-3621(+)